MSERAVDRVLFLDFDGVLHPATSRGWDSHIDVGPFEWIGHLAAVLQPHPDVEIAVHSSWRLVHSLDEISDMLSELGDRRVSVTPVGEKLDRILAWLRLNRIQSIAILDDQPEEFASPLSEHLIVCKPGLGVSDPGVLSGLRSWLKR